MQTELDFLHGTIVPLSDEARARITDLADALLGQSKSSLDPSAPIPIGSRTGEVSDGTVHPHHLPRGDVAQAILDCAYHGTNLA